MQVGAPVLHMRLKRSCHDERPFTGVVVGSYLNVDSVIEYIVEAPNGERVCAVGAELVPDEQGS